MQESPIENILKNARIIPVITVHDLLIARELIQALRKGGISVFEIVLRTPTALTILAELVKEFSDCTLGAGTVIHPNQMAKVKIAGAKFVISPGYTPALLKAAKDEDLPYLPAVATASEILEVLEQNLTLVKLFPADILGGINLLKTYAAVFPELRFCPTGGINLSNLKLFWEQKNVIAVGGSWLSPKKEMDMKDWQSITKLAQESLSLL